MKTSTFLFGAVALSSAAVVRAEKYIKDCKDEAIFINFGDLPDGTRTTRGQSVDPLLTYQGGTHFAVRAKSDNDNVFDDGIIIKNGKTNLQLGASLDISNSVSKPTRNGAEMLAVFDAPVIAHSLVILDPDNDDNGYKSYQDYGRIFLYGRKGLIRVFNLPPNNTRGPKLTNPGNLDLNKQIATWFDLKDTPGVMKMVVDTGDGGWKTIDRVKVTAPCDGRTYFSRQDVVTGGPFSRLPPAQRQRVIDQAREDGRKFEFPECVGKTVEECKALVENDAPECKGRIKAATPRKFDFYRIWIKCNDSGKVVGVPRRG